LRAYGAAKCDCVWGSVLNAARAPPTDPIVGFKGALCDGDEEVKGREKERGEGRKGVDSA